MDFLQWLKEILVNQIKMDTLTECLRFENLPLDSMQLKTIDSHSSGLYDGHFIISSAVCLWPECGNQSNTNRLITVRLQRKSRAVSFQNKKRYIVIWICIYPSLFVREKKHNRIEFGNGLWLCERNLVDWLHETLARFTLWVNFRQRATNKCMFFFRKNAYHSLFWKETVKSVLCNRTVA